MPRTTLYTRCFLCFAAAVLLASCGRNDSDIYDLSPKAVNLEAVLSPQSRVLTDLDFNCRMEEGDLMGVFAVRRTNPSAQAFPNTTGNYANNAKWIYTGGRWEPASPEDVIYYPADGMPLDFYVYHPYREGVDPTNIPCDASAGMEDPVTARTAGMTAATDPVRLQFSHKFALVELQTAAASPTVVLRPAATINLAARYHDDEISSAAGTAAAIPMAQASQDRYWAYVPPQSLPAGSRLFNMTHNNNSYGYAIQSPLELRGGRVKRYNVTPQGVNIHGEANAYIVAPGSTVNIPVSQAYRGWASEELATALPGSGSATAELRAGIEWQDVKGLVQSVTAIGNNDSGYIEVVTNAEAGSGNAVVSLRIDGTTCWSWHVWVTDYDPSKDGQTYTYRGYTIMDRNLGATSAIPGDVKALGNYYQWGRKDPFPRPYSWSLSASTVWLGDGSSTSKIPEIEVTRDAAANLTASIRTPRVYITSVDYPYDWYSTEYKDSCNRWCGIEGAKSVFDPCPAGWRVPKYVQSYPLWEGLSYGSTWNNGYVYDNIGYYPAGGAYKHNNTSGLSSTSDSGFLWYATPMDYSTYCYNFMNRTMQISNRYRATAANVRCVKE